MNYTRRAFTRLSLAAVAGYAALRPDASELHAEEAAPTLRELAAQKGLSFGAAVQPGMLAADPALAQLVAAQCSMLVPEGCLKWKALRPTPTTFDFSAGDAYVAYGQQHDQKIRGHTLAWHEATPNWFKEVLNRDNARSFLVDHIRAVVGRYASKIESWDVVNEAISVADGRPDHLRKTPWLELIGPDYLDIAFRTAAEADPGALLVYNDYGLEDDGDKSVAKRAAVLELLTGLKQRGVPVHAFGFQSHLTGKDNWQPTPGLPEFMRELTTLGLKIYVTELDVTDKPFPADFAARDRAVAAVYKAYLQVMLAEPAVRAILCWGITDKSTWLNHPIKRADGLPSRPLPFDELLRPTPVFDALAQAFQAAAKRVG